MKSCLKIHALDLDPRVKTGWVTYSNYILKRAYRPGKLNLPIIIIGY